MASETSADRIVLAVSESSADDGSLSVVSMYQPLVDRADALAAHAGRRVSDCWERGTHPRVAPASVHDFAELAGVVADLARAVAAPR